MFSDCRLLTNLDLSNFNTQNVTKMNDMFAFCSSLANLNLSNFNTQNVNDMSGMFYNCNSLTKKNLIITDSKIDKIEVINKMAMKTLDFVFIAAKMNNFLLLNVYMYILRGWSKLNDEVNI